MPKDYKMSKYNVFYRGKNKTLLYNTFSTGLIELDDDRIIKALEESIQDRKVPSNLTKGELEVLEKNGFIIDNELNELDRVKFRFRKGAYSNHGVAVQVLPTTGCNFDCPYCFERNKLPDMMSEKDCSEIESFINNQIDEIKPKEFQLGWYGGEPLLNVDVIVRISKYVNDLCRSKGVKQRTKNVITNGFLLNEMVAKRLAACEVDEVQITLDGGREDHNRTRYLRDGSGTFDQVLKAINIASDHFREVMVRFNIDRRNYKSIKTLIESEEVFAKPNVAIFPGYLQNYLGEGMTKEQDVHRFTGDEFRKVQMELLQLNNKKYAAKDDVLRFTTKNNNCRADAYCGYSIGPGCVVYKCLERIEPEESVGSIEGGVFKPNTKYWGWLMDEPYSNIACAECSYLPMCMGGCPSKRRLIGVPNDETCSFWRQYLKTKFESL